MIQDDEMIRNFTWEQKQLWILWKTLNCIKMSWIFGNLKISVSHISREKLMSTSVFALLYQTAELTTYLMHRIHVVLRVIALSLALHAMGCVGCSWSRTGPHHAVNWTRGGIRSRAGAQDGPWGQACPWWWARMGHATWRVWRRGHLPKCQDTSPLKGEKQQSLGIYSGKITTGKENKRKKKKNTVYNLNLNWHYINPFKVYNYYHT